MNNCWRPGKSGQHWRLSKIVYLEGLFWDVYFQVEDRKSLSCGCGWPEIWSGISRPILKQRKRLQFYVQRLMWNSKKCEFPSWNIMKQVGFRYYYELQEPILKADLKIWNLYRLFFLGREELTYWLNANSSGNEHHLWPANCTFLPLKRLRFCPCRWYCTGTLI